MMRASAMMRMNSIGAIGAADDSEEDRASEEEDDRAAPFVVHQCAKQDRVRGANFHGAGVAAGDKGRSGDAAVLIVSGMGAKTKADDDEHITHPAHESGTVR